RPATAQFTFFTTSTDDMIRVDFYKISGIAPEARPSSLQAIEGKNTYSK
ncbi:hypothetical protein Tco_0829637, partial [Tanacetum coccineum]